MLADSKFRPVLIPAKRNKDETLLIENSLDYCNRATCTKHALKAMQVLLNSRTIKGNNTRKATYNNLSKKPAVIIQTNQIYQIDPTIVEKIADK